MHRRHARDGVLADMRRPLAPHRHARRPWPVQAGEVEDVGDMLVGIEIADHVGPLAGRRDGGGAAARAVRQAFDRHDRDDCRVGAALQRRIKARAGRAARASARHRSRATGDANKRKVVDTRFLPSWRVPRSAIRWMPSPTERLHPAGAGRKALPRPSLLPARRSGYGVRRQVSWLSGPRLWPPSRFPSGILAVGSPTTVAGAAAA